MNASYEGDYYGWAFEKAERLRAGEPVDAENIAEELEDLGRHERHRLESRLARLIEHLLKIEHQPNKHTRSWDVTITEQRWQAVKILKENPSLKPKLNDIIADSYRLAVYKVIRETGLDEKAFPAECPYTAEHLLGSGV